MFRSSCLSQVTSRSWWVPPGGGEGSPSGGPRSGECANRRVLISCLCLFINDFFFFLILLFVLVPFNDT